MDNQQNPNNKGSDVSKEVQEPQVQTSTVEAPVQGNAQEVTQQTQTEAQAQQVGSTTIFQPQASEKLSTPKVSRFRLPKVPLKLISVLLFLVVLLASVAFLFSNFRTDSLTGLFGKRGEIVWWGFWDEQEVKPIIDDYQKVNPKVRVIYTKHSKVDYRERLTSALARGEGPDIFRYHNTWVPMFVNDLDYLPSSVIGESEFRKTYYSVIANDLSTKDGIVGLPLGYDAITLYMNEDIFAAAGKYPPKWWDEVLQLAEELTSTDEEGTIIQGGIAVGTISNVDHWQEILGLMMIQNRANPLLPGGEYAQDAIKYYLAFSKSAGVWDDTMPPSTIAFANGKVAMYLGPSWRAEEISKLNPNLRYKTVPLPQLRKDDPGTPDVSYATYWVEGVWKRSTNKDLAWDFLNFASSKESLEKLYSATQNNKLVGEPYPRIDMRESLIEDPIVGSIIALAPYAQGWYFVGHTNDGPTGINTQLSNLYEEAINQINSGKSYSKILEPLSQDIAKLLGQYGIKLR